MPFEVGEPPTRLCRNLTQLRDELLLTMVPLYSPRTKWIQKISMFLVSGYSEQCRKQPRCPSPAHRWKMSDFFLPRPSFLRSLRSWGISLCNPQQYVNRVLANNVLGNQIPLSVLHDFRDGRNPSGGCAIIL